MDISGQSQTMFNRGHIYEITFLLASFYLQICGGQYTINRANYKQIFDHYYNNGTSLTDVIPVINQSNPIRISMSMALDSLNGFDAVAGQIDISGSMTISWTDETSYGFTTSSTPVLIDYDKAWSPSLVLLNAVDTVKNIGDTTYKLKYNTSNNHVTWQPRVLLRAACSPDVTYYPFDRQTCKFTYSAWGYASEEISLHVTSSEWDQSNFSPNGIWAIISSSSSVNSKGGSDYARFEIVIQRQPLYFTFNIALPIILLGVLNGFVFLLPAESGERIGFCITCFLSFVVLLQTTMDFLPQIASPMSLLCYYVFLMMCFSVFINIVTIIMLRVYHKPAKDKVPRWLQRVVNVINCTICSYKCGKNKGKDIEEIEWPSVARVLDFFFFLSFVGGQVAMAIFFLMPLAIQYE